MEAKEHAGNVTVGALCKPPERSGGGFPRFGAIFFGGRRKDQAFAWLERDFRARAGFLTYLDLLPAYDTLRDDRRYTDLLRRMGLRP